MIESAETIWIINLLKGSESQQCNGHDTEPEVFIWAVLWAVGSSVTAQTQICILTRMWNISQCWVGFPVL